MPGFRDVPKKKWCKLCNGYMAHEYRESGCPPVYCNKCWRRSVHCATAFIVGIVVWLVLLILTLP